MGALLCACVSLLGRPGDRLTHVLVDEPFDDPRLSPRFFFNQQDAQKLRHGESTVTARDAKIELADIPFVPIRQLFARDLVRQPGSFTELVRRCSGKIDEISSRELRLEISCRECRIKVNDTVIRTSVRQHLLLLFVAQRLIKGEQALPNYAVARDDFLSFSKKLQGEVDGQNFGDWRHDLPSGLDYDQMERFCVKAKSELKAKLETAGPAGMALYRALPCARRFSLNLPVSAVTIIG